MKTLMTASAILVSAAAAQAGSLAEPVVEPAPTVAYVEPAPTGGDWTGGYAGLSFGAIQSELGGTDDNGQSYGAFAGYDYDFGRFVLGGELDYQAANDLSVGGVDIDDMTRIKLRGGYDLGQTLIYATLGAERASTSLGDADGGVAGLGLDYKVTERMTVGAEYLAHRWTDIGGTGVDANADTLSLRGAFRF